MLRMYLLQCWFSLSDEGVEDAIYDSYAMRKFMGINFFEQDVPDATTLLHFRHLLEEKGIGKLFFDAINRCLERAGRMMRGGSIVDATLISAPGSTKNAEKKRDPEMHSVKKGNQEKALGGFPAVGKEMVRRITDRVEYDAAPRLNGPLQREAMELRRRVNIQTSGNAQDWLF
jgi:IS5 family transposase